MHYQLAHVNANSFVVATGDYNQLYIDHQLYASDICFRFERRGSEVQRLTELTDLLKQVQSVPVALLCKS